MGLIRSVFTNLPCARCHRERRTDVQFKTGADWQQVYEEGDRVSDADDLPVGANYEGSVEIYCDPCFASWRADYENATFVALADCIERGRLRLSRVPGERWLSVAGLRAIFDERSARLGLDRGARSFEGLVGFVVEWDGRATPPLSSDYYAFVLSINRHTDARMKQDGWPSGREHVSDAVSVRIDGGAHIRVIENSVED